MSISRALLTGAARQSKLREIPEWKEVQGRDAIQRIFLFKDFKESWKFMGLVADKAEEVTKIGGLLNDKMSAVC